jgi:hypothetical protein
MSTRSLVSVVASQRDEERLQRRAEWDVPPMTPLDPRMLMGRLFSFESLLNRWAHV